MGVSDVADPFCEIGGLPASMCGHCRKVDLPATTDDLVIIATFTATRDSRCALDEDHDVGAGDVIGLAAHDGDPRADVGWVCPVCVRRILGSPGPEWAQR